MKAELRDSVNLKPLVLSVVAVMQKGNTMDEQRDPNEPEGFSMPAQMPYDEDLENRFRYHAPKGNQAARYSFLRDAARSVAYVIKAATPPSREQSLALTHLEDAVMWANAAIARHE